MGNMCDNYLRASGTEIQIEELVDLICAKFIDDVYDKDFIGNEDDLFCELNFNSSFRFPKDEFKAITDSHTNTEGLYIRVASDEPATNYLEQSIFKDEKWNFENPPSINEQIHQLTTQGIEQISKYLSENDKQLNIKKDRQWIVLYTDIRGRGTFSYFNKIKLEKNGKITVRLTNGVSLVEDEITTNHVLDILTIMEEGHGTYTK